MPGASSAREALAEAVLGKTYLIAVLEDVVLDDVVADVVVVVGFAVVVVAVVVAGFADEALATAPEKGCSGVAVVYVSFVGVMGALVGVLVVPVLVVGAEVGLAVVDVMGASVKLFVVEVAAKDGE